MTPLVCGSIVIVGAGVAEALARRRRHESAGTWWLLGAGGAVVVLFALAETT